uniref:NADPH:adrenodoxin oxidoreductase, mitochondrial n=1 Tax=Panagrellus redivivus TaxID=6233 RepID=A0A7E4UU66_PANRE
MFKRAFSTSSIRRAKIAVIGSGPAGLYTCAGIVSRLPNASVDVFDRSAIPYGLVQYGVAPDHYDVKRCINQFEKVFYDHGDRVSLFCNVQIGSDIMYDELVKDYDAVVLAYGANKARSLAIPGSDAVNCLSGGDFVAWYNGKYSKTLPLLNDPNAVVIGNGNVAIDCSRILLSSIQKLGQFDIPEKALKLLKSSNVQNIRIFGRRGPKEASFTIKELRELLNLENVTASTKISDEIAAALEKALPSLERPKKRILQLMLDRRSPKFPTADKSCAVEFFQKPVSIESDAAGRINAVTMENTQTGEQTRVPCGLLIYAIGYENVLLPGLPTNADGKLLMSDWCRVPNDFAKVYATGWCAHTPNGVIAVTQSEAVGVADEIAKDFSAEKPSNKPGAKARLDDRGVPYLTFHDWQYVDYCEKSMGSILGKLREKIQDAAAFIQLRK